MALSRKKQLRSAKLHCLECGEIIQMDYPRQISRQQSTKGFGFVSFHLYNRKAKAT